MELECIGVGAAGRLHRLPGPNPDAIARCFVIRHTDGYTCYLRDDVPPAVAAALLALPPARLFADATIVTRLLNCGHDAEASLWAGSAYIFERLPAPEEFPDVELRPDGTLVVQVEGEVAARAWSSRENARAAELAVETEPVFQRQGYARQVCSAWAYQQLIHGRVAFYSHHRENLASAALAQALGVAHFMDCVGYT